MNRTNPLPKISWQHQTGHCLNINPKCVPDSSSWKDISSSANVVISPGIDVPTVKSTLKIPKDAQSTFFKCAARNERGVDFHVMSFFSSGELTLYYYLLMLEKVCIGNRIEKNMCHNHCVEFLVKVHVY